MNLESKIGFRFFNKHQSEAIIDTDSGVNHGQSLGTNTTVLHFKKQFFSSMIATNIC